MNNEEHDDFAAKLLQIEEQANMALNDLPAGLAPQMAPYVTAAGQMPTAVAEQTSPLPSALQPRDLLADDRGP